MDGRYFVDCHARSKMADAIGAPPFRSSEAFDHSPSETRDANDFQEQEAGSLGRRQSAVGRNHWSYIIGHLSIIIWAFTENQLPKMTNEKYPMIYDH